MRRGGSPPSSNCSRKYTDDSARTDAADTANRSRHTAVMATQAAASYEKRLEEVNTEGNSVAAVRSEKRPRVLLSAPRCGEVTVDTNAETKPPRFSSRLGTDV